VHLGGEKIIDGSRKKLSVSTDIYNKTCYVYFFFLIWKEMLVFGNFLFLFAAFSFPTQPPPPLPSPLSPPSPIQKRAALHLDKEAEYTYGNISLD